jgi:hypothetical protein
MQAKTKLAQKCRTCGAPLTTEFLQKLSDSPGRWFPCPGHICPEYCSDVDGKIDQQKAVVLQRQLLI